MYDKYQSDTTQFLNDLIQKNPELEQERLQNRALLWDVTLNPEEQAQYEAAKLPKNPTPISPTKTFSGSLTVHDHLCHLPSPPM